MKNREFIYSLMFLYLGFILKFLLNIGFENKEWWIIVIPLLIVVSYQESKK